MPAPNRPGNVLPATNVDCPATTHQTQTAALRRGCICPEALLERDAYRAQNAAARREARRNAKGAPPTRPKGQTPPEIPVLGNVAKLVLRGPQAPACRDEDPELFFVDETRPGAASQLAAARRVCHRCPLLDDCLTAALRRGERFGVWGGLSASERRAMQNVGSEAA